MWIEKLSWISHGPQQNVPILSIDVQPLMERIITGAMDNTIRVWNFRGLIDPEEKELKLAELTVHIGPVNCVRWNPDTRTFASGSDDKLVVVWEQRDGALSDNIEQWRSYLTLSGHASDVKDLSWSKTGRLLASASIDNTIIVWNIEAKQNYPFKILKGHESFVTSVAFHPYDKYLVSLGEDKKLVVWDTVEWIEAKSMKPYMSHNSSQVMKRICFTPDARNLAIPGPKQANFRHMGNILNASTFEPEKYFSGHLQPVSAISASPVLYKSSKSDEKTLSWVLALGGYDSAISIWKESEAKPIAIRDLFNSAVNDISWSSDGRFLFACSSDSTVAAIYIANELGDTASQQEIHSYLFSLYSEFPPEPVIQHNLRKTTTKKTELQPINEQRVVRRSDGKLRVHPVMLISPEQPLVSNSKSQAKQSTSKNLPISSAASLPQLDLMNLGKRFSLSKVLCSSEATDYTENGISLSLLHVSQLVKASGDIVIEALSCEFREYNSVIYLKKGSKELWKDFICHKASLLSGSDYFAAVYTEEGYLYCYTIGGLPCLPELKIDNVKMMEGCSHFLAVVCKSSPINNSVFLYDLEKKEESIKSDLNNIEIKTLSLCSKGIPKIESKSGDLFSFDLGMRLWVKVNYPGPLHFEPKGWNPGPVSVQLASQDLENFESLKVSEVQNLLTKLAGLGCKEEYRYTAKRFVNMLLDTGNKVKILDFLNMLKKQEDFKHDKNISKNEAYSEGLHEEVSRIVESHQKWSSINQTSDE